MTRLRSPFFLAFGLGISAVTAAAVGCSPGGDTGTGSQESIQEGDLALAKEILDLLGGSKGKCNSCHSAAPEKVRSWGNAMISVEEQCFAPPGLSSVQRVDCMRTAPSDPQSAFSPRKLGLYAAGTRAPEMIDLFNAAYGDAGPTKHTQFHNQARMPRSGAPLTDEEFTKVKGWVLRGMPMLDEAASNGDAGADGGEGFPTSCTPRKTNELFQHIARMRTEGWGMRLADLATPMFGCAGATHATSCLSTFPDLSERVGAAGVDQVVRQLRVLPFESHYWLRTSADGRFVGFGLRTSGRIIDLATPESSPAIVVRAKWDPWFLPSNDGFAFAGALSDDAIHMCRQSLLADVAGDPAPTVTLREAKCTTLVDDVYMSIGSSLSGDRYFMTWGHHTNDDGGHRVQRPLSADFGEGSLTNFLPMVNDGLAYRAETSTTINLAHEGDLMLSPSTELAVTRFASGYRVRLVKASSAAGTTSVETPLVGEVCVPSGGKAAVSFDERFLAVHQYVDVENPEHATLPDRSSNIVVVDLFTGKTVRATTMGSRQFALYPHFRADGWLIFHVRDMNTMSEYVAATDVALRMAQSGTR